MDRLDPRATLVLVVDVQERLAAAMPPARMADLLRGTGILVEAARRLGAPIVYTEQYPRGLGPTIANLAAPLAAAGAARIEKTEFSACEAGGFDAAIAAAARAAGPLRAAVVTGMECHVCVYQTVRALVRSLPEVHVAEDAVASRRDDHREAGLGLCERAGAFRTTVETVVFDWLRCAGTDDFKALSKIVK